ncbi:MAG: DUF362 domain-containing protein [Chloroflexi bacterium]|nr:DUF362 domain-containing protein [Chloroflexota bacterium]
MTDVRFKVRAVHCAYDAEDEAVYEALCRAVDPLDRSWAKLKAARKIAIKFNQDWPPAKVVRYEGQLQELVSEKVARALLRVLRERLNAEIVSCDTSVHVKAYRNLTVRECMTLPDVLAEFDVPHYDMNQVPSSVVPVPGGGFMFREYRLPQPIVDADETISVQVIKNHRFMGTTLCLKNLFGLLPQQPHYHARQYFHHIIRMSYILPDLGITINPALNILDGLVCQARSEWGGEGRVGNTLLAGDHVIATDTVATHLMGHDPTEDWPTQPYVRDRNPLLVAAEGGFGTVKLDEIDWQSEVSAPIAEFGVHETDSYETILEWRRSTCEQALYYRDNMAKYQALYPGQYIMLQDGQVVWHDVSSNLTISRRILAGTSKDSALWFKFVDPEERESEHFEVYEQVLEGLRGL